MYVVAQVRKPALPGWDIGRRSTQDQIIPTNTVSGTAKMCLPVVGSTHLKGREGASVLLVKKTYLAVAVDCERGVRRVGNGQQIRRRPGYAAIGGATNMQC